ncbi:ganglioside GM2 activator-like [Tubulanus polymorphus]|uniref:ganglioside GM2 activator-like n=1 Tax=Tubulanus polymorphus TaxID=672921 RepID=UPI003DA66B0F
MNSRILVYVILQVVLLKSICDGKRTRRKREHHKRAKLHLEDCGGPHKLVRLVSLHAHPLPIMSPGKLRVSFRLHIAKQLPETIMLNVTVNKYLFGFAFAVPCIDDTIGTCSYHNICQHLSKRYESTCTCPRQMVKFGVPCTCPFKPGNYKMHNIGFHIPKLHGMAALMAQGEYDLRASLVDEKTGIELGCAYTKFSMKRKKPKGGGWFFGK